MWLLCLRPCILSLLQTHFVSLAVCMAGKSRCLQHVYGVHCKLAEGVQGPGQELYGTCITGSKNRQNIKLQFKHTPMLGAACPCCMCCRSSIQRPTDQQMTPVAVSAKCGFVLQLIQV